MQMVAIINDLCTESTNDCNWLFNVLLGVVGIVLFGVASYRLGVYVDDNYLLNEMSLPPIATDSMTLYKAFGIAYSCNIFAKGLFLQLTGVDLGVVEYLLCDSSRCYKFDEDSSEPKVHYYSYVWTVQNSGWNGPTQLAHSLVYYDGYLYQSYRTSRNWWSNYKDAYPPLRIYLKDMPDLNNCFRNGKGDMSVETFNCLCAPRSHPIPDDAPLRVAVHYEATVHPSRSVFSVKLPE